MSKFVFCSLVLAVLLCDKAMAQPFNLNDAIQPIELNLVNYKKDDPVAKGRINVTEVTQVKDTMYFFIKGFSMYSPAYFGITSVNHASPIAVNLNKENWAQANQSGETDNNGYWHTTFKTEGDFGIMVVPKEIPATYTLVTWVGDEAKDVGVVSPFKEAGAPAGGGSNFFTKNIVYIIGGAVILLLLGIIIFKRKK